VTLAKFAKLSREVLCTTSSNAIYRAGRVCLEVAMVIVDPEQLDIDKLTLGIGVVKYPAYANRRCRNSRRDQK
jgi:hypothetical protein